MEILIHSLCSPGTAKPGAGSLGQEVWSTNHIGGDAPSPLGVALVLETSWSPSLEGLKAGEGGGGQ